MRGERQREKERERERDRERERERERERNTQTENEFEVIFVLKLCKDEKVGSQYVKYLRLYKILSYA